MKIVILSGGTGSIALQTGLYNQLEKTHDGFDIKILCNAYDNGKSTGDVRRVLGGKILGPSDPRKNQTLRLKLLSTNDKVSQWVKFLEHRFMCASFNAKAECIDKYLTFRDKIDPEKKNNADEITDAIVAFFSSPVAELIDYDDFSIANIIYAGLAKLNGNSLRAAMRIMAQIIGIGDNVILNSDKSLFLGAITTNGTRIMDEAEIVTWDNPNDSITEVFFIDAFGNPDKPELCEEARHALLNANLIILSSGTQWSSLIPTYESLGFTETIAQTKAKVLMIMNRQPDRDSPSQTGDDIIDILTTRYFGLNRIHLIVDSTGHPQMMPVNTIDKLASINTFPLKQMYSDTTHDPVNLVRAIVRTYFRDFINSDHYMFDYDDTLVGRGNFQPLTSASNKLNIIALNQNHSVSICSGNGIRAIKLKKLDYCDKPLTVFADGGVNKYNLVFGIDSDNQSEYLHPIFLTCIKPDAIIKKNGAHGSINLMATLSKYGIPGSKIENRGDIIITVKPIDSEYRYAIYSLINFIIIDTGLIAQIAGRSTIDIMKPCVSKEHAVMFMLNEPNIKTITYVGDEFGDSSDFNDQKVKNLCDSRVRCLHISDPAETALFMMAIE